MINCIIIFFSLLLLPVSGHSSEYIPTMPTELNSTRISLLTVNDGVELYTRFGHTMLRIQDPSEDIDFVIHWGQFDFSDPLFIPKFFQGRGTELEIPRRIRHGSYCTHFTFFNGGAFHLPLKASSFGA